MFVHSYLVLAPEHPLLPSLVSATQIKTVYRILILFFSSLNTFYHVLLEDEYFSGQVDEYKELATRKSDLERAELQKDKTGVFTGSYAKNPASGEPIPIWVADYVLGR